MRSCIRWHRSSAMTMWPATAYCSRGQGWCWPPPASTARTSRPARRCCFRRARRLGTPDPRPGPRTQPAPTSRSSSPTPRAVPGATARSTWPSGVRACRAQPTCPGPTTATATSWWSTAPATADEIASAADLVKGKTAGRPAAVLRGLGDLVLPVGDHGLGAAELIRPSRRGPVRAGRPRGRRRGSARGDPVALAHFPPRVADRPGTVRRRRERAPGRPDRRRPRLDGRRVARAPAARRTTLPRRPRSTPAGCGSAAPCSPPHTGSWRAPTQAAATARRTPTPPGGTRIASAVLVRRLNVWVHGATV